MSYGYDFTKEEDVKEYLKNIGIEYRFRCYKENDPEVCHLLGMYFELIKDDAEQARQVFKVNCDNNKWGFSCHKYAYLLDREQKPENVDKVIHYSNLACENGKAKSCYFAATKMGEKAEKNPDLPDRESIFRKSLELMDKACTGKIGRACYNLSSLHFMGLPEINMTKNFSKVLEYSIKGCDNNHLQSCVNAAIMYAKGHGTEKNVNLAKSYEERARKLKKEMTTDGVSFEESL